MSKSGRSYSKKPTHRTYQAKRGSRMAKAAPNTIEQEKIEKTSIEENIIKKESETQFQESQIANSFSDKSTIKIPNKSGSFYDKVKTLIDKPFDQMKHEAAIEGKFLRRHIAMIVLKDCLICIVFTMLNVMAINSYQFSFVRMLFTDAVWLYLRMIVLLIGFEGILYLFLYVSVRCFKIQIDLNKWIRVYSCLCYPAAAAYFFAFILFLFGFAVGTAGLISALALNIILIIASIDMVAELNLYGRLSLAAAIGFTDTLWFWLWLAVCASDMLKIVNTIISA